LTDFYFAFGGSGRSKILWGTSLTTMMLLFDATIFFSLPMWTIPAARANSISLMHCSRSAVYFHSALRFFLFWLKFMANFFVVTD
jgi:hypothetical protein